jgi:dihydroorotase
MNTTRRRFLAESGSLLACGAVALDRGPALAAMGPNDKFDLLVKGGEVLDPSQNLRARRDIGIRWGMIEAVEPDIPADRALRVLDVAGKLVTPGLVDLHSHVYPYGSAIGIPADELLGFQGTTTMVSAGMPAPTTSRRLGATSSPRRAPGSMRSCTSPISG